MEASEAIQGLFCWHESRICFANLIDMIQLNELDKYIESRFQRVFLLKGINLTIKEGEFVTLMGVS